MWLKSSAGLFAFVAALSANSGALSQAEAESIRVGQTVRGELKSGDAQGADESFYDLYSFRGRAGQQLVIELKSKDFDAYLVIHRGDDEEALQSDDDGGNDTDSKITVTLPADGEYQIVANSVEAGETGAYTLALQQGARTAQAPRRGRGRDRADPAAEVLAAPSPAQIAVGQTLRGELASGDDRADDQSFYDGYRFRGARGDRVVLELKSEDFDSYLSVHRPGEPAELAFDDDGGEGENSRLEFTLPDDGEFEVRANSLSSGETGRYALTLAGEAELASAPAAFTTIAYGETMTGHLGGEDRKAQDESFFDVFRFRGVEGDEVVITMRSADVDSYVSLHRRGRDTEIAADDDGGGETDARLRFILPTTGEYEIRANSLGPGEVGDYSITLERPNKSGPPVRIA